MRLKRLTDSSDKPMQSATCLAKGQTLPNCSKTAPSPIKGQLAFLIFYSLHAQYCFDLNFVQHISLQRTALVNYEIGAHEPASSTTNAHRRVYNINPHWLVTGEGEMFRDVDKAKAAGFKPQTILDELIKKLGRIAYMTYRGMKIKLLPEDIAEIAAELYRKLQELVQNINDMEKIEATFPLLKPHLKR
ncbi:hypothetical protein V4B17_03770 [Bartonella sp. B23]